MAADQADVKHAADCCFNWYFLEEMKSYKLAWIHDEKSVAQFSVEKLKMSVEGE